MIPPADSSRFMSIRHSQPVAVPSTGYYFYPPILQRSATLSKYSNSGDQIFPSLYMGTARRSNSYDQTALSSYTKQATSQKLGDYSNEPLTNQETIKKTESNSLEVKDKATMFENLIQVLKQKKQEDDVLQKVAQEIVNSRVPPQCSRLYDDLKQSKNKEPTIHATIVTPRICNRNKTTARKGENNNKKNKMLELMKKNYLLSLENRLLYEMVIKNNLNPQKPNKPTYTKTKPPTTCSVPVIQIPLQVQTTPVPQPTCCEVPRPRQFTAPSRWRNVDSYEKDCVYDRGPNTDYRNEEFRPMIRRKYEAEQKQIVYMLEREPTKTGIPCYRVVLTNPFKCHKGMKIYSSAAVKKTSTSCSRNVTSNVKNSAATITTNTAATKIVTNTGTCKVDASDVKPNPEPTLPANADSRTISTKPNCETAIPDESANKYDTKCYIIQKSPNFTNQSDLKQPSNSEQRIISCNRTPLKMHKNLAKKIEEGQNFVICQSVPCSTESCASLFADVASLIESVVVKKFPNKENRQNFEMFSRQTRKQQQQQQQQPFEPICINQTTLDRNDYTPATFVVPQYTCPCPCPCSCPCPCPCPFFDSCFSFNKIPEEKCSSRKISNTTQTDQTPFSNCRNDQMECQEISRRKDKKRRRRRHRRSHICRYKCTSSSSSSSSSSSPSSCECISYCTSCSDSSDSCTHVCSKKHKRSKKHRHRKSEDTPAPPPQPALPPEENQYDYQGYQEELDPYAEQPYPYPGDEQYMYQDQANYYPEEQYPYQEQPYPAYANQVSEEPPAKKSFVKSLLKR